MFVYIYVLVRPPRAHAHICHVHNAMHYSMIQFNEKHSGSIQGKNTEINVCSAGENEKEHQKPQRRRKTG